MAIVGGALMPKFQRMNIDLGGTAVNYIKIIGVSEVNFFYTPIIMFFVYFMVWINSL